MFRSLFGKLFSAYVLIASFAPFAHAQGTNEPFDPLAEYREPGWGDAFAAANRCVSVGLDGSIISGALLPVSNERWLECETTKTVSYQALKVGAGDSWYCILGELTSSRANAENRMTAVVTSMSTSGPWTLRATSATGEAFTVHQVTDQSDPYPDALWPVWVEARYRLIDSRPTTTDGPDNCAAVYGL